MKLYAWTPSGHGQHSFYVCAASEQEARTAVDRLIAVDPYLQGYASRGWGTDHYELRVLKPGEVIDSPND